MTRVVCPICRTGFEANISRENFALNCVSCGVAFNAASFLSKDDFAAKADRRPNRTEKKSGFERGTAALGNVIRPVEAPPPPVFREPANDGTRTSGLPFMAEADEHIPEPAPVAAPAHNIRTVPKAGASNGTLQKFIGVPTPAHLPTVNLNGGGAPSDVPVATLPPAAPIAPVAPAASMAVAVPEPAPAAPAPLQKHQSTASVTFPPAQVEAPKPAPLPVEQKLKKRPPLLEGSFGPYDIEGEIARGGVGAVFKAVERSTGKNIALKVLLEGEDAGEAERERFRHECETAKALSLPGMVQVYDVGELDRRPYMAMELVDGKSLDKLIPEKTLSVNDCLVLMKSVAETIGALHEAGYVHRDLKPGNILIDSFGSPKVADFGLVKSLDEITRLTASGLVCGTPAYMAPEQARGDGKAVDPRSDVWALGAVLYEMLTCRPPFQAENALRLMRRITEDTPTAPRLLNLKVPQDVHDIVMKCLDKNPNKRYATARALAGDITRFLNGEPVEIRGPAKMQQFVAAAAENQRLLVAIGGSLVAIVMIAILARFVFAPEDTNALVDKAYAALTEKTLQEPERLDQAEKLLRHALQVNPKTARANLGLGLVLGRRGIDTQNHKVRDANKLGDALKATQLAGELDPLLAGECHAQTARFNMWLKQHVDEARELERALECNSSNLRYREALAMAYWNAGAQTRSNAYFKRAIQEFQTILNADPAYPRVRDHIKLLQERFLVQQSGNAQPEVTLNQRQ